MNFENLKTTACKMLGATCVLFLIGLICAIAEGTFSLFSGLIVGALCIVILNAVCSALLPAEEEPSVVTVHTAAPSLRVVRRGEAA